MFITKAYLDGLLVYCVQTVTHPSSNHLIATRPGVEPTTSPIVSPTPHRYATTNAAALVVCRPSLNFFNVLQRRAYFHSMD